MSRDLTTAEREKERQFLLAPKEWPYWPWLPVKHVEPGLSEFGAVYADDTVDGEPVRVFVRRIGSGTRHGETLTFADVDGLLDAGWRVD